MPMHQTELEPFLAAAVEIADDVQRNAYVERVCAGEPRRRAELQRMVRDYFAAGSLLESPAAIVATMDHAAERIGNMIGRYKLLEQIGEGGMGIVFVAEQTEPVRRRVALKIIKPGMDTEQVIARFEAERQALAMMDHPHIARVLDAGTTNEGRPYFVMELVRGMPITEYCDKARLAPRQRLELFVAVCQAVQHAHQKGIIHRDLKPSNVLITLHDGTPVVKVIDFGVAKAVGQQLTERTLYTALTQLVGTPLYMSPEQAEMSGLDVDTRSDVYSLGVLLYELLTGQTPFDRETLVKAGLDEIRRIIREDEPLRPSRRFSTLGAQASSTISQQRSLDERRLSKTLRGELDWIVMKALEKERSRRYESASSLTADIQRYLTDEPVHACPPTTMYRFHKFARKHKAALTTGVVIAVSLILGTTVSAWQAARATQAEAQANANESQAKEAAAAEAQQRQRAEANEQKANTQRDEAQRQRDEVKALNEKLQATQAELQHTLYIAHMNMARQAWEAGATDQVVELLERHRPKPGETDLRNFEWYYLDRLCHADRLTLKGHTARVSSVTYSPDGKRLASASQDGMVKVWDAQAGEELLTIKGGGSSVAFSPDGKRLAGASDTVKVWDAQTGQELLAFKGHSNRVGVLAYSPDSKRLASPSSENTVKVWDAQTGQELLSLKGHTGTVISVAFSPDGKRLASASVDGRAKVWDAQTGQELLTFKGHSGTVWSVAFSPDSKRLASASEDKTVKAWDAQTGQELLSLKAGGWKVAYSPDGKCLASTSGDKTVKVWDAQTGQELLTFKGHTGNVSSVAFSPDGKRLASASNDATVKIWDATTSPEARTLQGHTAGVMSVAYSPNGKRLASGSWDKTVKVWDAQTGQDLLSLKGHTAAVWGVAYSPDGQRLASAGRVVKIWDAQTGQELLTLKAGGSKVAYSPDGQRLASAPGDNTVKVWDAQTGQELLTFKGHNSAVNGVAFSPDSKRLASASMDQTVKVWDAQTGQEFLTLKGHTDAVERVAFSPDGKRLASGSRVEAKVWDAQTGQELLSLKGHTDHVRSVAFSPDGTRLATGSEDKTVKVWDAQTGQELLTLKGSGRGVAFSPDGHWLASGSQDGMVKIWDATPLQAESQAKTP